MNVNYIYGCFYQKILDDSNMPQIAALRKSCQEMLYKDLAQADETCGAIMDYISNVSGDVFPYD